MAEYLTNAEIVSKSVRGDLDKLAEARAELLRLTDQMGELLDEVVPDEIRQKQAEIREELQPQINQAQDQIAQLESLIKTQVVYVGETVSGSFLKAVFNQGRQSWDSKSLKAYAKNNPEVMEFYKQGDPYVSIRGI